jgi:hypothetical protein
VEDIGNLSDAVRIYVYNLAYYGLGMILIVGWLRRINRIRPHIVTIASAIIQRKE